YGLVRDHDTFPTRRSSDLLACDLRVAAEDATIGPSGLKRGAIPGGEQTQRLIRLIGLSRALEVLLLSRYIDGVEAHRLGIVHRRSEEHTSELQSRENLVCR